MILESFLFKKRKREEINFWSLKRKIIKLQVLEAVKSQKKFWRDFESLSKSKKLKIVKVQSQIKTQLFKQKLKQQSNVQSQIKTLPFRGKLRV